MIPTTDTAKRIATLFKRRLDTHWNEKEVKRYRQLVKDGSLREEGIDLIERYYVFQRKKGDAGIHRRDIYTFLNNFSGELDRAHAWDEEQCERLKRKVRRPLDNDKPQPVDDNEFKRIGELARLELERFKSTFRHT